MTKQHVVANQKGGWSVRKSDSSKASRVFDTKADAVGYGKELAKKQHAELYIHSKDGTIIEKKSFGSTTTSSKCKK